MLVHPLYSFDAPPLVAQVARFNLETDSNATGGCNLLYLIQQERWQEILRRLSFNPDEARRKVQVTIFGRGTTCYPLHMLCQKKRAPKAVFAALLSLHPQAAAFKDSFFRALPLHVALQSQVGWDKLDCLIEQYPASLSIQDNEGNLPLHLACSFAPAHTVLAILDTERGSASKLNKKNQTPLHLACNRYNISEDVVTALLEEYSNAPAQPDRQGQLPLHKAITWRAPLTVVDVLLSVNPEGIRKADKNGLTPYSLARKVINLKSQDPVLQELRHRRSKVGGLALRGRDQVQFVMERVQDRVSKTGRI